MGLHVFGFIKDDITVKLQHILYWIVVPSPADADLTCTECRGVALGLREGPEL